MRRFLAILCTLFILCSSLNLAVFATDGTTENVPENTVVLNDGGYSWIKEEKQQQSDTEKLKAKIAQLEKDLEAEIELRRAYQQENEKLKLKTEKLKSDYNAEKTIRNAYYREYTRFKNKFEQIGNEKVA